MIEGFARLGVEPLTPADPARRAGIVAVEHPDCIEIASRLAERDVFVWGKDGRVRAATHLYNTNADVDAFLDAVEPLL
jgi:selenocysteine lyase/cysteine desulfurase